MLQGEGLLRSIASGCVGILSGLCHEVETSPCVVSLGDVFGMTRVKGSYLIPSLSDCLEGFLLGILKKR